MGCWNETCAVSKMTINAGEKVYYVLMAQNAFQQEEVTGHAELPVRLKGGTSCELFGHWQPVGAPILAEYDDYGRIDSWDESEEPIIASLCGTINERLVPLKVGKNECHDLEVFAGLPFGDLLNVIQEGRLYLKAPYAHGDMLATTPCLIKESVWRDLVDGDYDVEDIGLAWQKEDDLLNLEKLKESFRNKMRLHEARGSSTTPIDELRRLENVCEMHRSVAWNLNPYIRSFTMNDGMLTRLAEFERVAILLDVLRIDLHPTVGSGSQTTNESIYKKVFRKWIDIAVKQEHSYDDL